MSKKTIDERSKKRRRKRRIQELKIAVLSIMIIVGLGIVVFAAICRVTGEVPFLEKKVADAKGDESQLSELESATTENAGQKDVEKAANQNIDSSIVTTDDAEEIEVTVIKEETPVVEEISMVFTGDVCFHDAFANMTSLKSRGGKIDSSIDGALLDEMKNADICMVNNEFPYSNRGTPRAGKAFTFRSKPENVGLLYEMGVDIVSLANNHIYDHGEEALLDTLDTLKNANMPYVGAGRNLQEASAPYVFELGGRKIAILSATQVERTASPETKGATETSPGAFRCYTDSEFSNLVSAIEKVDKEVDITIVYIHWGTENTDELHWAQTNQAPQIVAAGADLIVGDHPHCLQNIDYIDGVPVFYSLGNYWFNSKTLDTGLLKVVYDVDGKLNCQFIPAKQHNCRTDMETGAEKQRIIDYMQCISPNVTIDENGYITNKKYDGPPINYAAVERVPDPPAPPVDPNAQPATDPNAQPQPPVDANAQPQPSVDPNTQAQPSAEPNAQ